MADYTIAILPESDVTISGGTILDGVTQGDGSHLVGAFITLGNGPLTQLDVTDSGSDADFDDNDGNQRLDGAQTFDGVLFSNGTRIEAEYQFELRDNDTGEIYQVIGVNLRNSSPAFGTVEGLAFVGQFPPRGVSLEVISAAEGPGSSGQADIPAADFVTCFTPGVQIVTPEGNRAICDLRPGDDVINKDGEAVTIRWIGRRCFDHAQLLANPKLCPIRISAGALGNGLPKRDLLVSRQHRMLVQSKIAERMFGASDVLVPAIALTALPGIYIETDVQDVEYIHLLFDAHEVIFAEGAPSESLFTGPMALKSVSDEALQELLSIFPQLAAEDYQPKPACFIPRGKQQKKLIARHVRNKKPLLSNISFNASQSGWPA
ncbi:Hint domain-containing protein [Roseovarius rhodophyticola]|uniref:Hint domain-containing protein n=1 Tax=Roseovarius rhodophyticola TaxID=3080827 RepID=A0ABZ2TGJ2_9RHOB|nr:Hint domain-containing protein [Roseovarius sp. W115]MDV2929094.1 Hint domain-containing protein [Roseovarius sp. W115]